MDEWVNKGKLKPNQVAILSPFKQSNSSLATLSKARGVEITDEIERWQKGEGVLFSTVKGFKGLEADAIMLIDIPYNRESPIFQRADYYVACSRAKHLLVVINEH